MRRATGFYAPPERPKVKQRWRTVSKPKRLHPARRSSERHGLWLERNQEGVLYFRHPHGELGWVTWRVYPSGEAILRERGIGEGHRIPKGLFGRLKRGGHLFTDMSGPSGETGGYGSPSRPDFDWAESVELEKTLGSHPARRTSPSHHPKFVPVGRQGQEHQPSATRPPAKRAVPVDTRRTSPSVRQGASTKPGTRQQQLPLPSMSGSRSDRRETFRPPSTIEAVSPDRGRRPLPQDTTGGLRVSPMLLVVLVIVAVVLIALVR